MTKIEYETLSALIDGLTKKSKVSQFKEEEKVIKGNDIILLKNAIKKMVEEKN